MRKLDGLGIRAGRFGSTLHIYTHKMVDAASVTEALERAGLRPGHVREIEPGLEDVFIQMMGVEPGNEHNSAEESDGG
jgi:hypothetical protein